MASPLERLDAIRDDLINRGIGASGLTRQAIQRANLPQLSQAISTSRATRASEQRSRLSNLASRVARRPTVSQGRRSSGGSIPVRIVRGKEGFVVQGGDGTSSRGLTLDQLQKLLRDRPELAPFADLDLRERSPESVSRSLRFGGSKPFDNELAKRLGINIVPRRDLNKLLGFREPSGKLPAFKGSTNPFDILNDFTDDEGVTGEKGSEGGSGRGGETGGISGAGGNVSLS